MQVVMKISRMCIAAVVVCLVAFVSIDSGAQDTAIQEDKPVREVYQAQAMGQSTQMGKTFNVTLIIERYSTAEERQVLVEAFQVARSEGLYNALEKMHAFSSTRSEVTGTCDSVSV